MKFLKNLFNSKENKESIKISNLTDNELMLHYLEKSLSEININAEINNNELIINHLKMSIKGWVSNKTQHSNAIVLQLNFVIDQRDFENEIVESLAGIGKNINESIKNGTLSFVNGIFSTIIESFKENHNPKIDFETEWNGNICVWHPKIGSIQAQGNFDITTADENKIFNILKDDIKERIGNKRFYWIKLYVARQMNGDIITECTFNNHPFNEANNKMEDYAKSWDSFKQFKAEKQYIIIRQCDKTWSPSKYSSENIDIIINETIDIMEKYSTTPNFDSLIDNINNLTKDIDLAFELCCFIPEIYCSLMLPQVKYSDKVTIVMPDETMKSMYLSQFNIYEQIKKIIIKRFQTEFDKDKTQKILFMSSNFRAINDILNKGSKLENIVTAPMILNAPENYYPFR